jgi:hypothetical protein
MQHGVVPGDELHPPLRFTLEYVAAIPRIPERRTDECFADTDRYVLADKDVLNSLAEVQPRTHANIVSIVGFSRSATFVEMAACLLHVHPLSRSELHLGIHSRHYLLTPCQVESVVRWHERNARKLLQMDGYANFAFVEDAAHNPCVLGLTRESESNRWKVHIYPFEYDHRWHAASLLLVSGHTDYTKARGT